MPAMVLADLDRGTKLTQVWGSDSCHHMISIKHVISIKRRRAEQSIIAEQTGTVLTRTKQSRASF